MSDIQIILDKLEEIKELAESNARKINEMQNDKPKSEPAEPKSEPAEPKSEPAEPKSEPAEPKSEPAEPKSEVNTQEFRNLKALLEHPSWPEAVDPSLICDPNNEKDKEDRAEGILDIIIGVPVKNKKFLDFGCGEGHCSKLVDVKNGAISVGYDIVESDKWKGNNKLIYTTRFEDVKMHGPYDVILMYDVLDHIIGFENQISALESIKELCRKDTKIYIRCHPWTSRHATHLYHDLNKAYAHIIFTNEELEFLGYKQQEIEKNLHPGTHYSQLFNKVGLKKYRASAYNEPVEEFFINNAMVRRRITKAYKDSPREEMRNGSLFPPLVCQFIDYTLTVD